MIICSFRIVLPDQFKVILPKLTYSLLKTIELLLQRGDLLAGYFLKLIFILMRILLEVMAFSLSILRMLMRKVMTDMIELPLAIGNYLHFFFSLKG